MTQYAIDLKPGLGHVVGLTQFIDLLRRYQNQLGVLNAVLHLLGWPGGVSRLGPDCAHPEDNAIERAALRANLVRPIAPL
jgi:hypothetical protein